MSNEPKRDPIEESLRRSFAPPDLSALEASIDAAAANHSPVIDLPQRRRRTVLIATAIVAAAAAIFLFVWRSSERDPAQDHPRVAANEPRYAVGAKLVAFVNDKRLPPVVGETSCQAVRRPPDNCIDDAAKPWLPANASVQVIAECGGPDGPSCEHSGLSFGTGIQLQVLPQGPRFLVCMDPLARDPRPLLPKGSRLHLFRRELGNYVIYEITPLPQPRALSLFKL